MPCGPDAGELLVRQRRAEHVLGVAVDAGPRRRRGGSSGAGTVRSTHPLTGPRSLPRRAAAGNGTGRATQTWPVSSRGGAVRRTPLYAASTLSLPDAPGTAGSASPGAPDPLWASNHWDGWDTYAGSVPVPPPLDPEAAAALADRLARARDEVRTASGELLEHYRRHRRRRHPAGRGDPRRPRRGRPACPRRRAGGQHAGPAWPSSDEPVSQAPPATGTRRSRGPAW